MTNACTALPPVEGAREALSHEGASLCSGAEPLVPCAAAATLPPARAAGAAEGAARPAVDIVDECLDAVEEPGVTSKTAAADYERFKGVEELGACAKTAAADYNTFAEEADAFAGLKDLMELPELAKRKQDDDRLQDRLVEVAYARDSGIQLPGWSLTVSEQVPSTLGVLESMERIKPKGGASSPSGALTWPVNLLGHYQSTVPGESASKRRRLDTPSPTEPPAALPASLPPPPPVPTAPAPTPSPPSSSSTPAAVEEVVGAHSVTAQSGDDGALPAIALSKPLVLFIAITTHFFFFMRDGELFVRADRDEFVSVIDRHGQEGYTRNNTAVMTPELIARDNNPDFRTWSLKLKLLGKHIAGAFNRAWGPFPGKNGWAYREKVIENLKRAGVVASGTLPSTSTKKDHKFNFADYKRTDQQVWKMRLVRNSENQAEYDRLVRSLSASRA